MGKPLYLFYSDYGSSVKLKKLLLDHVQEYIIICVLHFVDCEYWFLSSICDCKEQNLIEERVQSSPYNLRFTINALECFGERLKGFKSTYWQEYEKIRKW